MIILDCSCSLQARMPSDHVCIRLELPPLPQLPNQDPPRLQQLILPDFLMVPHLRHTELIIVVITVGVYIRHSSKIQKQKNAIAVAVYITDFLELTFAGLHALGPPVICLSVTSTSTLLKPSTARSATTGSAGFLERTTLWAHHRASGRQGEG